MHGLYVLWWVQEKHVSVAAVAAILAAGDLALTFLEIPTGWGIETAISAIGLAIAWAMVEPPARADEVLADDAAPVGDRAITSRRSEPVRQLGSLLALIAPAAVVQAAASAGTFFVQSAA